MDVRPESGAYTSDSVAESSSSAWQGAKSSASVDILAPTQLHLVHNLNSHHTTLESQQCNYILNLASLTVSTGCSEDTFYHSLHFRDKTKNIDEVSFCGLYWCYIRVISRLY